MRCNKARKLHFTAIYVLCICILKVCLIWMLSPTIALFLQVNFFFLLNIVRVLVTKLRYPPCWVQHVYESCQSHFNPGALTRNSVCYYSLETRKPTCWRNIRLHHAYINALPGMLNSNSFRVVELFDVKLIYSKILLPGVLLKITGFSVLFQPFHTIWLSAFTQAAPLCKE